MASLKVPSTALYHFFRRSTYDKYAFAPEKTLRLVYGTFNLAIFYQCLYFSGVKKFRDSEILISITRNGE